MVSTDTHPAEASVVELGELDALLVKIAAKKPKNQLINLQKMNAETNPVNATRTLCVWLWISIDYFWLFFLETWDAEGLV